MKKILAYYYRRFKHDLLSVAAKRGLVNADRNYQKFIILSTPRTGSTLLQAYLNQHPGIFCQGEIYNTDHLKLHGKPQKIKREQQEDVIKFLYTYGFGLHFAKLKAVGFKLFYRHFSKQNRLWEHIAADTSIKIIHLNRENYLKTLVSHKIARKTNQWHDFKQRTGQNKSVTISKEELLQKHHQLRNAYQNSEKMFADHPMLTVKYSELTQKPDETMNAVFSFLCLKSHRIQPSGIVKQNPEPLKNLISNYDSLKEECSTDENLNKLFF